MDFPFISRLFLLMADVEKSYVPYLVVCFRTITDSFELIYRYGGNRKPTGTVRTVGYEFHLQDPDPHHCLVIIMLAD